MSPDADPRAAMITVNATLAVPGANLQLEITIPAGPTQPAELLPLFRSVSECLTGAAVQKAARQGFPVSCTKGCGACCRQIVPLSEMEARRIRELVAELPEPRRGTLLARFAAARRRLEEAGLIEILLAPERAAPQELEALVQDYFRLGIPCPFLEEESCSIHPERPIPCREYLVLSPAANCARFEPGAIKRLKIPASVADALHRYDAKGAVPNHWIPLILAIEWAETHPDGPPPRPGPELLRDLFGALTGNEIPSPPVSPDALSATAETPVPRS